MPDKVIHEIRMSQYSAVPADRTRRFSLGTKDSYGVEQLRIVPGEGWDGLTITATFHPPEGEAVQVLVPADGLIDVPPEATRSGSELPLKYGKIVFAGVADGVQRISCNLPYTVLDHAPVEGAESSGPAPSWYEQAAAHFLPGGGKAGQVLAKASDADLDVEWADGGNGTADHAKLSNRDASDQHPISAITGLETALDAKQPAGSYLTQESDPTVPDWAKQPEKPSYTADEVGALSAATLPEAITTALAQAKESGEFDGADGQDGAPGNDGITPNIGDNGNWYLGNTDTGIKAAGSDGTTPTIGANGNWWIGGKDTGMAAAGQAATIEIVGTETLPADQPAAVVETEGSTSQARKYTVKVPQGNTGATPDIKIGTVETLPAGSAATASMTGTPKNPLLNLGIPKGADGNAGKSAYQYAQDGGYTGTEAEFAAKLAQEIPTALPNPNALTFTGAVTGSYDGSAPLTVEMPSGGSGSGAIELVYQHICDGTYVSVTDDLPLENGKVYLTRLTLPAGSEKLTIRCLIGSDGNTYTGAVAAVVVDQHTVISKQVHSLIMKTATEIVGISYFGERVPEGTGYNLGQPSSAKLGDKIYFYTTNSGINLPDGTTVEVYRMN